MLKNRVKINICGMEYTILSEESEEYIKQIAKQIDYEMGNILEINTRFSVTMAAILTALKYCDGLKKSQHDADNLRIQIKDYLEESVEARMKFDQSEKEIVSLKKEIDTLNGIIDEFDAINAVNNSIK